MYVQQNNCRTCCKDEEDSCNMFGDCLVLRNTILRCLVAICTFRGSWVLCIYMYMKKMQRPRYVYLAEAAMGIKGVIQCTCRGFEKHEVKILHCNVYLTRNLRFLLNRHKENATSRYIYETFYHMYSGTWYMLWMIPLTT